MGTNDLLVSVSTSNLNAVMFEITGGSNLPTLIRYNKSNLAASVYEFGITFSSGSVISLGLSCEGIYCFVAYSREDKLYVSKISEVDNSISTKFYSGNAAKVYRFMKLLINADSVFAIGSRIKVGDHDGSDKKRLYISRYRKDLSETDFMCGNSYSTPSIALNDVTSAFTAGIP